MTYRTKPADAQAQLDANLDWRAHAEDICVPPQGEIAIFTAFDGRSVAMWQRGWPDDDNRILISHRYLGEVIARLQALAAEIAEDERWADAHPAEAAEERRAIQRELSGADDADNDDDPPMASPRHAPPLQPRLIDDEWREPIAEYVANASRITTAEIAEDVLHLNINTLGSIARRRIADILTALGFEPRRDKHQRWWERGDASSADAHVTNASPHTSPVTVAACAIPSPVKRST